MQSIKLSLLVTSVLGLTACLGPSGQVFGDQVEYLENDSGNSVAECTTAVSWQTGEPLFSPIRESRANVFWRDNNLPKGTLYYVCDGDKALLPKDCQGNSLTTPQIRRYWKKYNLPVGSKEFDCSSSIPKVAKGS